MKGNIAVFFLFIVVGMATMEAVKAGEILRGTGEGREVLPGTVWMSLPEWRQVLKELKAEALGPVGPGNPENPENPETPEEYRRKMQELQEELQAEAEELQAEAEVLRNLRKTEEWQTYLSQTYSQIADFYKTAEIQADWQKESYFRRKWRHYSYKLGELASRLPEPAELAAAVAVELGSLAEHFTKKLYFPTYFPRHLEEAQEEEEEEEEDMRSQDVQGGTGSIWIAAGLSSLATFCVAAIALILLNLKGQRKVGQKEVSLVNNNILGNADTR